jgi:N-formylglutamate amidohydrolase
MKKALSILLFLGFLTLKAQPYTSGNRYFGRNDYIEYRAGNLPIIITAPHGGRLEPTTIPDRNCAACTTVMDANTMELAYQIDTAIQQVFGCFPHIVVNQLHRIKLDANREIVEAALGNADAETAWGEWHNFVQNAKNQTKNAFGRGLLIDLHGHGHTIQRLEIGYLADATDLRLSDSVLSTPQYSRILSIKNLVLNNLNRFTAAQLLRGEFALGTLLGVKNFPSVPSQQDPAPQVADLYFNGGYNTFRHGSRDSTTIDALQIECNFTGVRNTYENRRRFAAELATTLKTYFAKHYFVNPINCRTATIETTNLGVHISPNPVQNSLKITFDAPQLGVFDCQIFNLQGQLVLQKTLEFSGQNDNILDTTPLSNGVYFLKIRDGVLKFSINLGN